MIKKIKLNLRTSIVLLFISSISFLSCENENQNESLESNFKDKIIYEFNKFSETESRHEPSQYISNEFKLILDKIENCQTPECVTSNYNPKGSFETRDLNAKEKTFLEWYLSESKAQTDFYSFNRHAYNSIDKLGMNRESELFLNKVLNIHYDINLYINNDFIDTNGNSTILARSCIDACMNNKLKALQEGNWVDELAFFVGLPESLAWMAASCAWDCRHDLE